MAVVLVVVLTWGLFLRSPGPGKLASCTSCLDVTRIAILGEDAGPQSPRKEAIPSRNSRGEYVVTRTHDLTRVVVYGPDGKVRASWGREGSGPGEFRQIAAVAWLSDDTLIVLDSGNQRLSLWRADSTLLREAKFAAHGRVLARRDGRAYLHRRNAAGSAARPPFLVWSPDQELIEFGDIGELSSATDIRLNSLAMGLGKADSLWVAQVNSYRLALYSPDGKLARTLVPDASWFRGVQFRPPSLILAILRGTGDAIEGVTADDQGRVWVGITHMYFRQLILLRRSGGEHGTPTPEEIDSAADFVLDVLDPTTGGTLATRLFTSGTFGGFIDAHHMWTVRELSDGQVVLDVWRFALTRSRD